MFLSKRSQAIMALVAITALVAGCTQKDSQTIAEKISQGMAEKMINKKDQPQGNLALQEELDAKRAQTVKIEPFQPGVAYKYPGNLGAQHSVYVQTITTKEGAYCVLAIAGRDVPTLACDFSNLHQKTPVPAK